MAHKLLPIGAVAQRFGLRTSTLRYYEDTGLLQPAERRSGRRYYGPAELARLALIRLLQETAMSLEDISVLLAGPTSGQRTWHEVVRDRLAALDEQIRRAQASRDYLAHMTDCPRDNPLVDCPVLQDIVEHRVEVPGQAYPQCDRERHELERQRCFALCKPG